MGVGPKGEGPTQAFGQDCIRDGTLEEILPEERIMEITRLFPAEVSAGTKAGRPRVVSGA